MKATLWFAAFLLIPGLIVAACGDMPHYLAARIEELMPCDKPGRGRRR